MSPVGEEYAGKCFTTDSSGQQGVCVGERLELKEVGGTPSGTRKLAVVGMYGIIIIVMLLMLLLI